MVCQIRILGEGVIDDGILNILSENDDNLNMTAKEIRHLRMNFSYLK